MDEEENNKAVKTEKLKNVDASREIVTLDDDSTKEVKQVVSSALFVYISLLHLVQTKCFRGVECELLIRHVSIYSIDFFLLWSLIRMLQLNSVRVAHFISDYLIRSCRHFY